jgi:hypothetical protein
MKRDWRGNFVWLLLGVLAAGLATLALIPK